MYCKQCGHRSEEKTDLCPKCGAALTSTFELGPQQKRKVRWYVVVIAALIGVIGFVVVPRVFLRTELESIGPTDKLRLLRALQNSEYKKMGQRELRIEGQTLVVIWDLRWTVLPDEKQQQLVRNIGKAWRVVGGADTRFRIEGDDNDVAVSK
jgi:hypothetical protein